MRRRNLGAVREEGFGLWYCHCRRTSSASSSVALLGHRRIVDPLLRTDNSSYNALFDQPASLINLKLDNILC